jgi:endoglucanase Acf2
MTIGDANDAAYITPDPMTARVTDRGFRVMGIPSGLATAGDRFLYSVPDPFSEVFDGIAIGNADFSNLEAYLKDFSDGSATVEWQSGGQAVMEATFVHGSPYVYVQAYQGELVIRTLRTDGGEKGTFYSQGNSLGIWTGVAGNHNNFLITGEGATTFGNATGNEISVSNAANALTLTYLPQTTGVPADVLTGFFEARARNVVAAVDIDYTVDRSTNNVTISHTYRDSLGVPIETIAGMHPMHWKNSTQPTSAYQVRSARGTIKFSRTDTFSYHLSSVGVLPALPTIGGSFDQATLEGLVSEFVAQGPNSWNNRTDTYWAGKNYGKVAELIAIADSIGMDAEATQLRDWLKAELSDWFTAETNGNLDIVKYFVYDDEWNTLLGLEESFSSHQNLNDHHFHYGYFVRAAAEICRVDIAWCGADQYGPMIELLIRDYAGDEDDPMFPHLRNFDPANGFSWASGSVNFVRGNNNESTSEAANAYGAITLYGLITGQDDLVEKGMYLHASTAAAYWQYWNNIDGYNNRGTEEDNFPAGYNRITTSIIWGDGAVLSTWFSSAFAHILGIQGLPSNALILHVGQYSDYMIDYVALGLSESSNIRPSGLPEDQWRDLWWNLWAMTDADASIADYNTVADYAPEAGETKAHTYHWIHTFRTLGHMITGTGALTADYPAALAFDNNGVTSYVVYNFSGQTLEVSFSDGQIMNATPYGFSIVTN